MSANMFRSVKGQVHVGKTSVIEDRGYLRKAFSTNEGMYLFSERGAGLEDLILIGTRTEIIIWLGSHYKKGIDNRINIIPQIYMAIEPYKPGARFKGLFPLQDVVMDIFDAGMGIFGPSNVLIDIIGGGFDLKSALEFKPEIGSSEKFKSPKYNGELYITFSYLPRQKMQQIGEGSVDFQTIRKLVQKAT